jgi:predicted GNAT family N-acyltransferase
LLGRLAVDGQHRGHGHGELLLMDAFGRTLRSEIASFAFVVDAKDEAAAGFCGRFGFLSLTQRGPRMFLPITEIAKLLA